MGWEPIDAEYESQMEAIYNGVLDEYLKSDSYHEDINRAIDDFTTDRQKAFYLKVPTLTEPAFNLLAEAKDLFELNHYGAAQVMAGAAAEVAFGDALLKPMVYGLVHNETMAPEVAKIIENARRCISLGPCSLRSYRNSVALTLMRLVPALRKACGNLSTRCESRGTMCCTGMVY